VSHSAIVLLPHSPAAYGDCRYIDRCNRALTSDGCRSCRFSRDGCYAEGSRADSGSRPNLIAISWAEAAR
jgi:hypothetical protein